jgi:Mor family transcriptional regulator
MSYIRADEILPKELLEELQQYADGQLIYIPRKEKQEWGSGTSAKKYFRERNERIYRAFREGIGEEELARRFSLSGKSIQRILRKQKLAAASGDEDI